MRRGLMVLSPHVQLGKTIVPVLIILQHLRAACGQAYAFAGMGSLRTAVAAYDADAASATAAYGPISSWDVSAVTSMNTLFTDLAKFNADISSWDTSSVTDMAFMFRVRFACALPSASKVGASLLLAPPTAPPHPPACLPACRPSAYASPFYSAARVRVQPAAEPRHVQRHRHGGDVSRALRACRALSLQSRGLPARCLHHRPPTPPSRLLARMSPLLLASPFFLGRPRPRSTSR